MLFLIVISIPSEILNLSQIKVNMLKKDGALSALKRKFVVNIMGPAVDFYYKSYLNYFIQNQ